MAAALALCVAALALPASPRFALAAPPDPTTATAAHNGQDYADAGLQAYARREFEVAAHQFELAYAAAGRPEDLFNAGRAHEDAGDVERARAFYLRFIATEGVPDAHRQQTQTRLAALTKQARPAASPPPPPRPTVQSDRTAKLHWTTGVGIGLAPVAVGTLATGAAFAVTAMKNATNAARSATAERPQSETPQQQLALRHAKLADSMLIAGGVTLATSLVFVLVGLERRRRLRRSAKPAQVAVALDAGRLALSF